MIRLILWVLSPVLDKHTRRPSGPRCMAWAIYAAALAQRPIPAAIATLLLATMFGYSMFKDTIGKTTLAVTAADAVNLTAKYEHTITESTQRVIEQRDPALGFDPSRPRPDPDHNEPSGVAP